jgi:PadR family transcriptional regulator PadR
LHTLKIGTSHNRHIQNDLFTLCKNIGGMPFFFPNQNGTFCELLRLSYGHSKGAPLPSLAMSKGNRSVTERSDVLQGTLDLMVLKTLHALGPQHGFGIARRIEQVSEDVLKLNEGTVYTSLLRLQQQGWISAGWGTSDNNRKAKFYSITPAGSKQLALETAEWERISGVIGRVLKLEGEKP